MEDKFHIDSKMENLQEALQFTQKDHDLCYNFLYESKGF